MSNTFTTIHPNIAHFVDAIGWIEIGYGHQGYLTSFIRALDEGGMIWEGADEYLTFDAALADLEAGLGEWLREMG